MTPESANLGRQPPPPSVPSDRWSDDACVADVDCFVKTLVSIKASGVGGDLVGPIISHYASRWLPELADRSSAAFPGRESSPREVSATASWMKKKFLVETLVGVLPPEKGAVPCGFLLRLLRAASSVGAEPGCEAELEGRVARRLEEASLEELMIPSFSHTCGTLLDVGLVIRLVKGFLASQDSAKSGASALVRVARLLDAYLAEASMDSGLKLPEFMDLAGALPGHARATDDGLYRAIDTYMKAHPSLPKQDKRALCCLIDTQKLSREATNHAAHNDRLPVRVLVQLLFSHHQSSAKPRYEWSGEAFGRVLLRSPHKATRAADPPGWHVWRRDAAAPQQQSEIRKLREELGRLQRHCSAMQGQIDKLAEKKKKGFFRWGSRLGLVGSAARVGGAAENGGERTTGVSDRSSPKKWRKSM